MLHFNIPFDLLFGIHVRVSCHPDVFCFANFAVIPIQKENVISGVIKSVTMSVVPQETIGNICPSIIF